MNSYQLYTKGVSALVFILPSPGHCLNLSPELSDRLIEKSVTRSELNIDGRMEGFPPVKPEIPERKINFMFFSQI